MQLLITWSRFQNVLLWRARSRADWIRQYVYTLTIFGHTFASVLTWKKAYFATLLASTIISRFLDYRGLSIRNRIKYRYKITPSKIELRSKINKPQLFLRNCRPHRCLGLLLGYPREVH